MTSHTTNEQAKQLRAWSDLQYQRFHTVVIEEGRKLLYEDKYWQGNKKPDKLLWSNLSVSVIAKLVENVRNELEEDDMETTMKIDIDIIKWKLQPWLRKKYNQSARQPNPAMPSATEDRQSPAGQTPDPALVGTEVGAYQVADRPAALPDSGPSQYYDPVADAAKGNSGAA